MGFLRLSGMHLFHSHGSGEKLQCPYKGCEKHFDRPTVITDDSVIPCQTHYACPFCMSRLELETAKEKIVSIRTTEYPSFWFTRQMCPLQRALKRAAKKHVNSGWMLDLPQSAAM